jgi:hypothetical protein
MHAVFSSNDSDIGSFLGRGHGLAFILFARVVRSILLHQIHEKSLKKQNFTGEFLRLWTLQGEASFSPLKRRRAVCVGAIIELERWSGPLFQPSTSSMDR